MAFNDKTYGFLKWIALYFLPALGTLYFALARVWGLPYGEEVVGVILGISTHNYEGDGVLTVNADDPEKDIYNLELNIPVEELPNRKTIVFKVDSAAKTKE